MSVTPKNWKEYIKQGPEYKKLKDVWQDVAHEIPPARQWDSSYNSWQKWYMKNYRENWKTHKGPGEVIDILEELPKNLPIHMIKNKITDISDSSGALFQYIQDILEPDTEARGPATRVSKIKDKYPQLSNRFIDEIIDTAEYIGTKPMYLADLINAESNFNPRAQNPITDAVGLIQLMPYNAANLLEYEPLPANKRTSGKLRDKWSRRDQRRAVNKVKSMSRIDQMDLVRKYFRPYRNKVRDKHDLYMAVFYPAYINKDPDTEFPEYIQEVNYGIKSPREYAEFIDRIGGVA